ncbi:regulatory LuxR family protein [Microterricola gilva]|uniref:Regulatory LuxR family protein n=1 Tax=Microterricola gilva TaxID=393267 RepID=A0A4Q8AKL2_9MICO|nr:helix-turn-helix transcriptional regulator [Microterricola gilva]RZU65057.1 regulatory LuxR family protein [Microterricola gilva]
MGAADTLSRARERIERLAGATSDAAQYRSAVLRELSGVLAFDAHVWVLTDPQTAVGAAPHARVPAHGELPRLIRYKYLTELNRWTALADAGIAATSLLRASAGEPERSLLWREVLRAYAVLDVASLVLADSRGCWGFLDLWRSGEAVPFTPRELAFLASLAPGMTRAIRARQAATFTSIPAAATEPRGPVLLLLDDALVVQSQTPAAEAWLGALVPSSDGGAVVPASVYNVAAQLLAVEAGVDAHEPLARVHLSAGTWLTVRAGRVGEQIAVSLDPSSPAERLDLFAAAHALSARERTVLELLAAGADTRTIAERMYVSELTVQDHCTAIFAKASVHNRRSLLARILGTRELS